MESRLITVLELKMDVGTIGDKEIKSMIIVNNGKDMPEADREAVELNMRPIAEIMHRNVLRLAKKILEGVTNAREETSS